MKRFHPVAIAYAYATVSFIYFLKVWKQLLPYFFLAEFLSLLTMLNPLIFGGWYVIANLSGIVVGILAVLLSKKLLEKGFA